VARAGVLHASWIHGDLARNRLLPAEGSTQAGGAPCKGRHIDSELHRLGRVESGPETPVAFPIACIWIWVRDVSNGGLDRWSCCATRDHRLSGAYLRLLTARRASSCLERLTCERALSASWPRELRSGSAHPRDEQAHAG
jgi:hypothetical protein